MTEPMGRNVIARGQSSYGVEVTEHRLSERDLQDDDVDTLDRARAPARGEAGPRLKSPQSWRQPDAHLETLVTTPWYPAIFELFSVLNFATHDFFRLEAASIAFAPLTTGSISSPMGLASDSVPVQAQIGGRTIYLADSMQFALELALRVTGRPTYYLLPSFRGEGSDARHLNQFVHAEAEMRGGLDDVMAFVERYFRFLTRALLSEARKTLNLFGSNIKSLDSVAAGTGPFRRIRFAEAVRVLADCDGAFERCETGDLRITSLGERALLDRHRAPIWITHMPARTVPFYQAISPDDPEISLTADLLTGVGETVGAGERALTDADVIANLARGQVCADDYRWYIDMKRAQPWRTAGFGLGVERFLMWATGTRDIRDWSFLLRNEFGEGSP
ncbi:asparagine synthetase A [Bradyrhizobium sp. HKCCYLS3013]|uniref:asparagine synthetase A n=1 Tax=Bradyrhizobium sp. HKCCYLS3013 TaxID=3420735 RepID=UPI003EBC0B04